jgi:ABC-type protease/lipase transport system fused ATPase/permease subunit
MLSMQADTPRQPTRFPAELRAAAVLSGVANMLVLTGSIYMLQLCDRVLPSHSVSTLVGPDARLGVFDVLRMRMMSRIGVRIERSLRARVFSAVMLLPLRAGPRGDGLQSVRDADQIRGFLSGQAADDVDRYTRENMRASHDQLSSRACMAMVSR